MPLIRTIRIPTFKLLELCVIIILTVWISGLLLFITQISQRKTAPPVVFWEAFLVKPYWQPYQSRLLPNLSKLRWPRVEYSNRLVGSLLSNGSRVAKSAPFEPVMSRGQSKLIRRLLRLFSDSMFSNGLGDCFFLTGGTLLGSLRHHDIIPWDDDADVMVDESVHHRMKAILERLKPNYVFIDHDGRGKFFAKIIPRELEQQDEELSRKTTQYPWGWPFLDIGYYMHNKTHIRETAFYRDRFLSWSKQLVYPLRLRPFGKHWYPVPFNSIAFMRSTKTLDPDCLSGFDHVFEQTTLCYPRPCRELSHRYAFVKRQQVVNLLMFGQSNERKAAELSLVIVEEELIIGTPDNLSKVIHTINLPSTQEEANLDMFDYVSVKA